LRRHPRPGGSTPVDRARLHALLQTRGHGGGSGLCRGQGRRAHLTCQALGGGSGQAFACIDRCGRCSRCLAVLRPSRAWAGSAPVPSFVSCSKFEFARQTPPFNFSLLVENVLVSVQSLPVSFPHELRYSPLREDDHTHNSQWTTVLAGFRRARASVETNCRFA
jgi:hypothetical protein